MRAAFGLVILGVMLIAPPAIAQTDTIVIEIDEVTRGPENSVTTLEERTVDPAMVGAICTGTARTGNNASEHPDNDFILISGSSTTLIPDWEREAGAAVSTTMSLVLGDSITVQLRLGPHRVSSGAVSITLSCSQPEPTTTTTTSTTTSTSTTTTSTTQPPPQATTSTSPVPSTTTTVATTSTVPPPVGGVSAGGGSTAPQGPTAAGWWLLAGGFAAAAAVLLAGFARSGGRSEELGLPGRRE